MIKVTEVHPRRLVYLNPNRVEAVYGTSNTKAYGSVVLLFTGEEIQTTESAIAVVNLIDEAQLKENTDG